MGYPSPPNGREFALEREVIVSTLQADDARFVELLKRAVAEVLDERRDWFEAMVAEAIEDLALTKAIREGENSERVDRAEVFSQLEP